MKLKTISLSIALTALISTPLVSIAGSAFDQAYKEAEAEIDKAKAANNEWRDSRKILEEAQKAEKAGDHKKAMELAAKAKEQGQLAVVQAKDQEKAGPR